MAERGNCPLPLDAEYGTDGAGGAAGRLLAHGLDEESLENLRRRLTGEPEPSTGA